VYLYEVIIFILFPSTTFPPFISARTWPSPYVVFRALPVVASEPDLDADRLLLTLPATVAVLSDVVVTDSRTKPCPLDQGRQSKEGHVSGSAVKQAVLTWRDQSLDNIAPLLFAASPSAAELCRADRLRLMVVPDLISTQPPRHPF
jgi:hypothetical protein